MGHLEGPSWWVTGTKRDEPIGSKASCPESPRAELRFSPFGCVQRKVRGDREWRPHALPGGDVFCHSLAGLYLQSCLPLSPVAPLFASWEAGAGPVLTQHARCPGTPLCAQPSSGTVEIFVHWNGEWGLNHVCWLNESDASWWHFQSSL